MIIVYLFVLTDVMLSLLLLYEIANRSARRRIYVTNVMSRYSDLSYSNVPALPAKVGIEGSIDVGYAMLTKIKVRRYCSMIP